MKYTILLFLCACLMTQQGFSGQKISIEGWVGIQASGTNCSKMLDSDDSYPAILTQEKLGDGSIPDGVIVKLTAEISNNRKVLLAAYRTSNNGNVYHALSLSNNEVIGKVRAVYSPLLAQTVRYKIVSKTVRVRDRDGGRNLVDEIWVTTIFRDFPIHAMVSGSRTTLGYDCILDWVGEFTDVIAD